MQADFHAAYLKRFLKKLISEVELDHVDVLDELYQLYAEYMASLKVYCASNLHTTCELLLYF